MRRDRRLVGMSDDRRLNVLQLDSHYQSRWTGQGLIGSEEFVLAV